MKSEKELERAAHDELLRRCRASGPARWVMRQGHDGQPACAIIDLGATEPNPQPRAAWDRWRDKRIATGESWREILETIDAAGEATK